MRSSSLRSPSLSLLGWMNGTGACFRECFVLRARIPYLRATTRAIFAKRLTAPRRLNCTVYNVWYAAHMSQYIDLHPSFMYIQTHTHSRTQHILYSV